MTVLFTDSGAGSNANPAGGSYVTLTGWAAVQRTSNTIANATGSSQDCAARINVTTDNDHYCQFRVPTVGGKDGGPMVRCQSGAATGVLTTAYDGINWEAYQVVAGGFDFKDRDVATYVSNSVPYLEVQGTNYVSKLLGVTVNSFSDATLTSGQAGAFLYDSAMRIDQIEVGNFSSGTAYSLSLAQGSYSLGGQTVGLRSARRVTAAQGSYALNGQSVGLAYSGAARTIAVAQGSYTLNGQAKGLRADRKIAAAQGSYALTGQALALKHAVKLQVAQGSYALNGQSVGLAGPIVGYALAMGQGSYSYTGSDAAVDVGINIGTGTYTLTGNAVGLKAGRKTSMGQGSYTYSGQALGLGIARTMSLAQGAYALSGQAVGLDQHAPAPRITIATGSYSLIGNQVTLLYSGNKGDIFRNLPLNWWTKGI